MRKDEFEFIIASPTDREKLICEIYYNNELICEISQETNELILEIYSPQENQWWEIPLFKFQNALDIAKKHLLGQMNESESSQ